MESLPEKNEDYKKQEYWDNRYKDEEHYDWFASYSAFKHLVHQTVSLSDKVLMLGCGNSRLSEEMYLDGFKSITNMDYSPVVIEAMSKRHHDKPSMTWDVMDMTNMTYAEQSFDVVFEKGTLDAMCTDEKDTWSMSNEIQDLFHTVLTQVSSILRPGGRFISLTFMDPYFRKPFYARQEYDWDIHVLKFGDNFHFYYLVMTKGKELSEDDKRLRDNFVSRNSGSIQLPRELSSESEDEDFLLNISSPST